MNRVYDGWVLAVLKRCEQKSKLVRDLCGILESLRDLGLEEFLVSPPQAEYSHLYRAFGCAHPGRGFAL